MQSLETRELSIGYGDTVVVDTLTTPIPTGRITSIVGPNGSGKSTLLKALVRILKPMHGAAYLDGAAVHRQSTKAVARQIGLLSQEASVPEAITVEDLVRRGRFPHQRFLQPISRQDSEAVEAALSLAGVTELRDRSVDRLSGGQRQRAWIAMLLAQDTPTLLLDEPTTYLDLAHQQEVLDLVHVLNRDHGKTVVMVLHDLNQAAQVSDHMVLLQDGAIAASGPPSEIVTPHWLSRIFGIEARVLCAEGSGGRQTYIPEHCTGTCNVFTPGAGGALHAERLQLGYERNVVVNQLDLEVPRGAITAIIGANACGKSTLLRALGGVKRAWQGRVLVDGRPTRGMSRRSVSQSLSFLAQEQHTMDLTVEEMVAAGRFPHQRWWRQWSSADAVAIESAISATGMEAMRKQRVDTLSGGQRQRARVAMLLAQDTPILLLDEPTTYLDIAHQEELLRLVSTLRAEHGRTVVMVLHDLNHASAYADHIVAMKGGRVVATGHPGDVITPGLVRELYGVDCDVIPHPTCGRPVVMGLRRAGSGAAGEATEQIKEGMAQMPDSQTAPLARSS